MVVPFSPDPAVCAGRKCSEMMQAGMKGRLFVWHGGGVIKEYREFLPVTDRTPVVSLLEGNTPLIKCDNLRNAIHPDIEPSKVRRCRPHGVLHQ
jgi:threonine synthase